MRIPHDFKGDADFDSWLEKNPFEGVKEDLDPEGMGYYNVVYHDDEIETALPYDEAIKKAKEFIENVWLGGPPKVKKIEKGGSVVFTWKDVEGMDSVTVEPTDDADVEAWFGENIELDSIVEGVLNEAQPKDYADEEEIDVEPGRDEPEANDYPEAEDEELGLRFD